MSYNQNYMDEKHAANLFSEIMETPKPSYKELLEELEKKKEQYKKASKKYYDKTFKAKTNMTEEEKKELEKAKKKRSEYYNKKHFDKINIKLNKKRKLYLINLKEFLESSYSYDEYTETTIYITPRNLKEALYLNLKDDYAIFDSRLIKPLMINLLGNECYRKKTYENINRFYYIFNFTYLMKQINDELKCK